jgi:hypothetical protein
MMILLVEWREYVSPNSAASAKNLVEWIGRERQFAKIHPLRDPGKQESPSGRTAQAHKAPGLCGFSHSSRYKPWIIAVNWTMALQLAIVRWQDDRRAGYFK